MIAFFWISLFVIFYTFIGYGIVLYLLVKIKSFFQRPAANTPFVSSDSFTCSILIAAYNEESCIRAKIKNTLSLNYPSHLLKIFVVADGSSDRTTQIVSEYPEITLLYTPERKGKIAAVDRAMKFIESGIVIFTDANAFLNKDAIIHICNNYYDDRVGGVAGEKRIFTNQDNADASAAGESFYWRYESTLKAMDSKLNSAVGAAGELFSIRTGLYESLPSNTILDDFIISMTIAARGYRIIYEPKAYAVELSSLNVEEELKRKIRIAAGGIQSIVRLRGLLNPFRQPLLTFQYVSHRVLRWCVTPILLLILLAMNIVLVGTSSGYIYMILLYGQILFYGLAAMGYLLENKQLNVKIAFIPYYFCVMNYAALAGIWRYFTSKQSAVWSKAQRKETIKNKEFIPTNQY